VVPPKYQNVHFMLSVQRVFVIFFTAIIY